MHPCFASLLAFTSATEFNHISTNHFDLIDRIPKSKPNFAQPPELVCRLSKLKQVTQLLDRKAILWLLSNPTGLPFSQNLGSIVGGQFLKGPLSPFSTLSANSVLLISSSSVRIDLIHLQMKSFTDKSFQKQIRILKIDEFWKSKNLEIAKKKKV